MQRMKESSGPTRKRGMFAAARALDDFKKAKAAFEKCRSTRAGAEKTTEAKKNLFLAAEVLAEVAQKKNLERKCRAAIDFYKVQIGLTNLCVKAFEYFVIPATLYLSLRLIGTESGTEIARAGLVVTAASFILQTKGIAFENNNLVKEQYEKIDALREAAGIARSRNSEG